MTISFTGSSNAPGGQTYTATVCTNGAMTTGCVTEANYTSGAQITGLNTVTHLLRDDHRGRLGRLHLGHARRSRADRHIH